MSSIQQRENVSASSQSVAASVAQASGLGRERATCFSRHKMSAERWEDVKRGHAVKKLVMKRPRVNIFNGL